MEDSELGSTQSEKESKGILCSPTDDQAKNSNNKWSPSVDGQNIPQSVRRSETCWLVNHLVRSGYVTPPP